MKTSKTVQILTTILLFVTLFWAFLWSGMFWNRVRILMHRHEYRRATFTVKSVGFQESIGSDDTAMPIYWADGTIDGKPERMSLQPVLNKIPVSLKDTQNSVPTGTSFDVFYNPRMSKTFVQGETLRIFPFQDGYWEKERHLVHRMILRVYLPFTLAVLLKIISSFLIQSKRKKTSNLTID
jgi:hypothetical protein